MIARRLAVIGVPIALCLAGSSLVAQVTGDRSPAPRASRSSGSPMPAPTTANGSRRSTRSTARTSGAWRSSGCSRRRVQGLARDDAPGHRRRDVPDDAPEPRLRDRRPHRPAALALRARAAQGDVPLVAVRRTGDSARSAISCSWARSTPTWWRSMPRPAASAGTSRPPRANEGYSFTGAPLVVKDKVHRRAPPAASTGSAGSSTPTRPRPGSARGASTRFPARASRATTAGPAISWKTRRRPGVGHRCRTTRR